MKDFKKEIQETEKEIERLYLTAYGNDGELINRFDHEKIDVLEMKLKQLTLLSELYMGWTKEEILNMEAECQFGTG